MEDDSEPNQLAYAQALADYGDAGGYDAEVTFDACCIAAIGISYERAKWRPLNTLSGGEQKRLALEVLLRGPDEVLLLDEPDNYLDVPAKRWLENQLAQHAEDGAAGQPRPRAAGPGGHGHRRRGARRPPATRSGSTAAASPRFAEARRERFARFEELRRRWDEEHAKLKALVLMYKIKAAYNDGLASATRRPRPGWPSSWRPGRRRPCRWSSGCRCGSAAGGPASGPSWWRIWS